MRIEEHDGQLLRVRQERERMMGMQKGPTTTTLTHPCGHTRTVRGYVGPAEAARQTQYPCKACRRAAAQAAHEAEEARRRAYLATPEGQAEEAARQAEAARQREAAEAAKVVAAARRAAAVAEWAGAPSRWRKTRTDLEREARIGEYDNFRGFDRALAARKRDVVAHTLLRDHGYTLDYRSDSGTIYVVIRECRVRLADHDLGYADYGTREQVHRGGPDIVFTAHEETETIAEAVAYVLAQVAECEEDQAELKAGRIEFRAPAPAN